MRIRIKSLIAIILSILILLSTPTGVDSYHYIFTFRNLDFILSEPPYNVFGISLTRYLCFPYLYLALSGFGLFPPIAPLLILTFLVIRNILFFLHYYRSPSILITSLILASLLYSGAVSSFAICALVVLFLQHRRLSTCEGYLPTTLEKIEATILLCLTFSSITMLPITLFFIAYLYKQKSKLLPYLYPVFIFVFFTALVLPHFYNNFQVDNLQLIRKGAFYSRRQLDIQTFEERYYGNIFYYLSSLGYTSKFPIYLGTSFLLITVSRLQLRQITRYLIYILYATIVVIFLGFNLVFHTVSPTLGQKTADILSYDYDKSIFSEKCLYALLTPDLFVQHLTRLELQDMRFFCYRIQ